MSIVFLYLFSLSVYAASCALIQKPESFESLPDNGDKKGRQFFNFPSFPNFPTFPSYPSYSSNLNWPSFPQYPAVVVSSASHPAAGGTNWLASPVFTSWLQSVAAFSAQQGGSALPSFPSVPGFPQRPQITVIAINPTNQPDSPLTTEQPIVFETTTQAPTTTEEPKYTVASTSMYNCPQPGAFEHSDNCVQFYRCFEYVPGSLNGILYRCPAGYAFSPKHERCLKEGNLPACEKTGFIKKSHQEESVSKEEIDRLMSLIV